MRPTTATNPMTRADVEALAAARWPGREVSVGTNVHGLHFLILHPTTPRREWAGQTWHGATWAALATSAGLTGKGAP